MGDYRGIQFLAHVKEKYREMIRKLITNFSPDCWADIAAQVQDEEAFVVIYAYSLMPRAHHIPYGNADHMPHKWKGNVHTIKGAGWKVKCAIKIGSIATVECFVTKVLPAISERFTLSTATEWDSNSATFFNWEANDLVGGQLVKTGVPFRDYQDIVEPTGNESDPFRVVLDNEVK